MARKSKTLPAEDLQRLDGIGPVTARRLYAAGIRTVAQLAQMSSSQEIVARVPGLSAKRIEHEGWLKQSRHLTAKQLASTRANKGSETDYLSQHYANFTVEFLLNPDNDIQRVRIKHIQAGNEKTWSRWNWANLVDFFVQQGRLNVKSSEDHLSSDSPRILTSNKKRKAQPQTTPPSESTSLRAGFRESSAAHSSPEPVSRVESGTVHDFDTAKQEVYPSNLHSAHEPSSNSQLEIVTIGIDGLGRIVHSSQRFCVDLVINLSKTGVLVNKPLDYGVIIWAKKLGEKSRVIIGEKRGTFMPEDETKCSIEVSIDTRGFYRLEMLATLSEQKAEFMPRLKLATMQKSKPLQVI